MTNKVVIIKKKRIPSDTEEIKILKGEGLKSCSLPPTPINILNTLIKYYSSNHHR